MSNKMKDSGIEWVGEFPDDWNVRRVKEIAKWQTGFTPETRNEDYYNGNDMWITIGDMDGKYINKSKNKINGFLFPKHWITPANSLLFSFKLSVGQVAFNKEKVFTNEAICSFSNKSKINLNYFYYAAPVFIVKNAKKNIYDADLLNQDLIANALCLIPPASQQTAIADFLDRQTSIIDKQISLLEQKVEKLNEYKQSLIYETVTKGLDANVKMKDSGIEWIGEIPAHWVARRLKDYLIIKKGESFNEELASDEGCYPYINGGIKPSAMTNIFNTKENTIAVSEGGASAGYAQFMKTRYWAGSHCYKIQSKNKSSNNKYIFYVLKGFEKYLMIEKTGSAMPNLQKTKFINYLVIFVDNIEEQNKIVSFLDMTTSKIDKQISLLEQKVEKLKEYKQALIYEAVTGKISIQDNY